MKDALRKTWLFVSVPLGLAVLADLFLTVFYQGQSLKEILPLHGVLFASILVLCGLGAFVSFVVLRGRSAPRNTVLLAALLFAVVSFFAVMVAFSLGGPFALGAWLVLGAAAFSAGAVLVGSRRGGSQETPPK